MYKNIFFDRSSSTIHLWDSERGYTSFNYRPYGYVKDENGEYESIYGDNLTKIPYPKAEHGELFESDVPPTTRTLIDLYTDSDELSEGNTVLTFDIEVEMETGLPNPLTGENEITAIGGHDSLTNEYFVYILDKESTLTERFADIDGKKVHVKPFDNERNLLQFFINKYQEINPDILTGWNIDFFDIPYLYNRLKNVLGEDEANKLSPIGIVKFHNRREIFQIAGVSSLDYMMLYKKFTYSELDNYRLDTVGKMEIGMGKVEYDGSLDDLFRNDINKFIEYNLVDVDIVVGLDKKLDLIDLARGICHIGHVPYDDIVFSSRYLEGALLTYLRRKGKVAPNRKFEVFEEDTVKFSGAFVKEPIPGKYDWIFDLDLTSLYPSIIMSLNISPETKMGVIKNFDLYKYIAGEDNNYELNGKILSASDIKQVLEQFNLSLSPNGVLYDLTKEGCIPDILNTWFETRIQYRKLESEYGKSGDEEKYQFYKKRQHIQKILLNSLYGVLGMQNWRFFDLDNAEAVTRTGVEVIQNTAKAASKKYSNELGISDDYVTYVDTDSIFVTAVPILNKRFPDWKDYSDDEIAVKVNEIASETQQYLNSFYDVMSKRMFNVTNHRFEIKKEYVAKAGFWVAKKRYAQWIISDNGVPVEKLDVKGLDSVRSSFPMAFREFMSEILIGILKGEDEISLSNRITEFKNKLPNLGILEISKSTAVKNMTKYLPKGKQGSLFSFRKSTPAHVKAAIAYNQLLIHFKCPYKYPPFKDGDKLKWAYLKNNPYGLDALAFSGDEDPDEIMDIIQTYIDYDKIFERELLSKFTDFFSALGWRSVISHQTKGQEFFSF